MEKEVTGMYLTGHPMGAYASLYQMDVYARTDDILRSAQEEGEQLYRDGQRVTVLAIVTQVRTKVTRSGGTMAFLTLEDMYGSLTALVFPKVWEQDRELVQEGAVLQAQGKLSFTENKEPELLADSLSPAPKEGPAPAPPPQGGETRALPAAGFQGGPPVPEGIAVHRPVRRGALKRAVPHLPGQREDLPGPGQVQDRGKRALAPGLEKLLGRENVAFVERAPAPVGEPAGERAENCRNVV